LIKIKRHRQVNHESRVFEEYIPFIELRLLELLMPKSPNFDSAVLDG